MPRPARIPGNKMRPDFPKTIRPGYPESPCINMCTLDEAKQCMGCFRTLDEIIAWSTMTAEQQWRVVMQLQARSGH